MGLKGRLSQTSRQCMSVFRPLLHRVTMSRRHTRRHPARQIWRVLPPRGFARLVRRENDNGRTRGPAVVR
ncbi:MAG: hypothetical protein OJF62_002225 [Pseudolabrys sp.]|nr:hypothetical protein [Pseudolabrys sp.]